MALARLEKDGLVRREEPRGSPRSRRHNVRVMYYPTDRAEPARREWLARPVRRESTRSDLFARMLVAREGDERLILAALDDYERDIIRLLERYTTHERSPGRGFASLLRATVDDDICTLLRADQEWVDRARRRIVTYMEEHGI